MIDFLIEALPIAKPRMSRKDKWAPRPCVEHYWGWSDMVKWTAKMHIDEPMTGGLWLLAVFSLPIPPSWSKTKAGQANRELALCDKLPHIVKPDLKNLVAGLEDSLNGIAWHDDSQIIGHITRKKYAPVPGCYVSIFTDEQYWDFDDTAFQVVHWSRPNGSRTECGHLP